LIKAANGTLLSSTILSRYQGIYLTGDINNRTFFEVPTNTTIYELIYKFGGGIPAGKKFKAVQIGGTSGLYSHGIT